MKRNMILKTGATGLAAALLVFLFSACPIDTPENSPSTYTITYSPGEGSGSIASVIKNEGETVRLSDGLGFTAPEGKTFENWKDGAGNAYAAGSSYSKDEDLSLTAQWKILEEKKEIKKTITVTDLPGGKSALAVYLSAVQNLSDTSDITAAGGLPSGGAISAGQVSYLLYQYSEGGGSPPLWTGSGNYYVYLCWDGSSIATEVSKAAINFDTETTTISYTNTFQAFTQKKVEVLSQTGSITTGTGGTATYQINRYNISTSTGTIKWYSNSAGTTEISAPAGISDNTGSLPGFTTEGDHEKSTITITVSNTVPAGVYYFRASIEGYYSAVKTLTVGSVMGSFNASELNGWKVMAASAGDVDSTQVSSDHSGSGLGPESDNYSGKIHYDGGTGVLTYWYNSAKRTANLASPADDHFHNLLSSIAVGNEIGIYDGKVSRFNKLASANWDIDFDSIQSAILNSYVIIINRFSAPSEPICISGTFPGTTLSLQGNHTDDAFAVPDGLSLTMEAGKILSFNSSSNLVLGTNSSLVLKNDGTDGTFMCGYGKLVAGQTEFSFGNEEDSGWSAGGTTGTVTITRTGANASSITATDGAYLNGIFIDTNLPAITQKQGNADNRLTIGCTVCLGPNASGTQKVGSLLLEGTGTNKGLVTLSGNGTISTTPEDSMGTQSTGINGLDITGDFVLRKDNSVSNKFLFIRPNSGTIDITPSGSSNFELSAETPVN